MGVINTMWWLTYVNMKIFWVPLYQKFPFQWRPSWIWHIRSVQQIQNGRHQNRNSWLCGTQNIFIFTYVSHHVVLITFIIFFCLWSNIFSVTTIWWYKIMIFHNFCDSYGCHKFIFKFIYYTYQQHLAIMQ